MWFIYVHGDKVLLTLVGLLPSWCLFPSEHDSWFYDALSIFIFSGITLRGVIVLDPVASLPQFLPNDFFTR